MHVQIPMRDVTVVEKVENSSLITQGLHISTRAKVKGRIDGSEGGGSGGDGIGIWW